MNQASKGLKQSLGNDVVLKDTLEKYIDMIRTYCMGNIMWSLHTERYKLNPFLDQDGGLTVKT